MPEPATSRCRDHECQALILWTTTARGKAQPVDASEAADGTVHVTTHGLSLRSEIVDPNSPPLGGWAGTLHHPHHQTCPAAHRWRTRKGTS